MKNFDITAPEAKVKEPKRSRKKSSAERKAADVEEEVRANKLTRTPIHYESKKGT